MPKEAYYFSHDTNARTDPKIMAMLLEYKSEGYGLYWSVVEMLSEQDEYKLELNKITFNAIAMAMLCDTNTVLKFINSCIDDYDLFKSYGDYFWSESLIRRMSLKEEKRQKRSLAGKKGAESRWNDNNYISNKFQNNSNTITKHSIAIAKHSKVNESKVSESKVNENKVNDTFYYDIVEAYNIICVSFPKVKQLTEKRKAKLKARFQELKTLEEFEELFHKVEQSDFLKGKNKNNWKCSFDWLIENDNNYVKVLEGQFDRAENTVFVNPWQGMSS